MGSLHPDRKCHSRRGRAVSSARIEAMESRLLLAAQLVKDINTQGLPGIGRTQVVGSQMFFVHATPAAGRELWVTDGSAAGARLVKDLVPGPGSSGINWMTSVGQTLFFVASDGYGGDELWKSDGSHAGTLRVRDINPGHNSSQPQFLTAVGNMLYFSANDGVHGQELWKSDGTEAGTVMVEDIQTGPFTISSEPADLMAVGNRLFFSATQPDYGREWFISDGTETGTYRVADIGAGNNDGLPANPQYLAVLDDVLYFEATADPAGRELWRTDGTAQGTYLVKDIYPGYFGPQPSYLTRVGNRIVFAANDLTSGMELWATDGTLVGTKRIADLAPGDASSNPTEFTLVGQTLYFTTSDSFGVPTLWKTDGTASGTTLVSSAPNPGWSARQLREAGGKLFFIARENATGDEWWVSEGSAATTHRISDIWPGVPGTPITGPTAFNGLLYFAAAPQAGQLQLWRSNGTPAGTEPVTDLYAATDSASSSPRNLTPSGNNLFFTANNGLIGEELWKTDGTDSGTSLVKDIRAGGLSSNPTSLTAVNNMLCFFANDGIHGYEMWRSDGTAGGTYAIVDLAPGDPSMGPGSFVRYGDDLLFSVLSATNQWEVWITNGTTAGTNRLFATFSGSLQGINSPSTIIGNSEYFAGRDSQPGLQLWKRDLITGIPTQLTSFPNQPYQSFVSDLIVSNGTLFFVRSGTGTLELWKLVNDQPVRVRGPLGGDNFSLSSAPFLTDINGTLYFSAHTNSAGTELWKTDGTEQGTIPVRDIFPGLADSGPVNLVNFNGLLCFLASAPDGFGLWRSDGTEQGTFRLAQMSQTTKNPTLTVVGNRLFAAGYDGDRGAELWESDGTIAGTVRAADLATDSGSSEPHSMASVQGQLFFAARAGWEGVELYKISTGATRPQASSNGFDPDAGKWIDVQFTGDVLPSINPGDLAITTQPGGQIVQVVQVLLNHANNSARFVLDGVLPDGNYTAALARADVIDVMGNPLAADISFSFFVLGADANHDRRVDIHDLSVFMTNFMKPGVKTFSQGDFNYDGMVDRADLSYLARNWQKTLPAFVPPPPAAASALPKRPPARSINLIR